MFAFLAWRRVLFPEYGHDIPFRVVNTTAGDGSLSAERTFEFGTRTRVMQDRMTVVDGALHDRLGRRGGLEVELGLEVVDGRAPDDVTSPVAARRDRCASASRASCGCGSMSGRPPRASGWTCV